MLISQGPVSATEGDDASTSSPAAGGDAEIVVGEVKLIVYKYPQNPGIFSSLQWSAVRVTAVTVTVGYSDSFWNP